MLYLVEGIIEGKMLQEFENEVNEKKSKVIYLI